MEEDSPLNRHVGEPQARSASQPCTLQALRDDTVQLMAQCDDLLSEIEHLQDEVPPEPALPVPERRAWDALYDELRERVVPPSVLAATSVKDSPFAAEARQAHLRIVQRRQRVRLLRDAVYLRQHVRMLREETARLVNDADRLLAHRRAISEAVQLAQQRRQAWAEWSDFLRQRHDVLCAWANRAAAHQMARRHPRGVPET
jgi:hypothetical protein